MFERLCIHRRTFGRSLWDATTSRGTIKLRHGTCSNACVYVVGRLGVRCGTNNQSCGLTVKMRRGTCSNACVYVVGRLGVRCGTLDPVVWTDC